MSSTPDETIAEIIMFAAMPNSWIADRIGVSETTVSKYLNQYQDHVRAVDNPEFAYWYWVSPRVLGEDMRHWLAKALS